MKKRSSITVLLMLPVFALIGWAAALNLNQNNRAAIHEEPLIPQHPIPLDKKHISAEVVRQVTRQLQNRVLSYPPGRSYKFEKIEIRKCQLLLNKGQIDLTTWVDFGLKDPVHPFLKTSSWDVQCRLTKTKGPSYQGVLGVPGSSGTKPIRVPIIIPINVPKEQKCDCAVRGIAII